MFDIVLTKKDLAEKMAEEFGITKARAAEYVQFTFDQMADTLEKKGTVDVFGFGKFTISHREARQGRNPFTNETIEIAASDSIKFKPAKKLKDAVK